MLKQLSTMMAAGLVFVSSAACAAAAATAPACGESIQGAVTLSADLVCKTGHGLVVKNGAALDCAGHRITGGDRSGQYGIYVREGVNSVVKNCVAEGFEVGIRLRNATQAIVRNSVAQDNLRYGIEVTQGSTGALIQANKILDNGDEGIHLSGPEDRDAGHRILDNAIEGNVAEGIYFFHSNGSLVAGNTIRDHGAAGIYVKGSARNTIDRNTLINDPLHVVYGSQHNAFTGNTIVGHQVRFKEASNNEVHGLTVRADGARPDVAYDFIRASGNVIADSRAVKASEYDIQARSGSTGNVFTHFSGSSAVHCAVERGSSVSVTNARGRTVACGK